MQEPVWVNDAVVLPIHRRQLAEHGGGDGMRDAGLLDSALNKPKQLWHYGDPKPDLADIAAAYAYGIARNHPFVDGNKRTAFVVCHLFLKLNQIELVADQKNKYDTFIKLAAGELSEEELAQWIRQNIAKSA
ncbi:MAG: type II toxin-antitoxin system death-on-curing family toxin [Sphaerospermopsis sp. SIO1G2]|nr:type II toxin-antitoxin system death-on-curing family toxin [Sphaerospermopsis sp. SIO1G2]